MSWKEREKEIKEREGVEISQKSMEIGEVEKGLWQGRETKVIAALWISGRGDSGDAASPEIIFCENHFR